MSHYSCSNCGFPEGIDYGICERCTPKRYFDAQSLKRTLHNKHDQRLSIHKDQQLKTALEGDALYQSLCAQLIEMEKNKSRI